MQEETAESLGKVDGHLNGKSTGNGVVMEEGGSAASEEMMRFQCDLEFVQFLSNPFYIQFLVSKGYLDDHKFLNYLKYLNYFNQPQYFRYIRYPICLKMLEKLQDSSYVQLWRGGPGFALMADDQIRAHHILLSEQATNLQSKLTPPVQANQNGH